MTTIAQTPIAQQLALILGTEYNPDEVLLPYQRIWIADESPLKIAEKSRRTGITWAEAADAELVDTVGPSTSASAVIDPSADPSGPSSGH